MNKLIIALTIALVSGAAAQADERSEKTLQVLLHHERRISALEKELQKTRDQVAHIVKMQRAKTAK